MKALNNTYSQKRTDQELSDKTVAILCKISQSDLLINSDTRMGLYRENLNVI